MPTRTMVWTSVGGELAGTVIGSMDLPVFAGAFTLTITASAPSPAIARFGIDFNDLAAPAICWTDNLVFIAGDTTKGDIRTVGIPTFDWHCSSWTVLTWYVAGPTQPIGADITWTLVISGDGIPDPDTGYCAYGTEALEPGQSVVQITAQLAGQLIPEAGIWAFPIALMSAGLYVAIPALCSAPPPSDEAIVPGDFFSLDSSFPGTVFQRKVANKLKRSLWLKFCKCKPAPPGNPAPIIYIDAHWEKPTWYVSDTTNIISNTDIAVTLNHLLVNQTTNTFTTNNTNTTTTNNTTTINEINATVTEIHGCTCGGMYEHGAVHDGLVAEGSFVVENLQGIEVEILERPDKPVLIGHPDYLWDMGWLSILNADGMLDEKRLTRENQVWLSPSAGFATEVGYTLFAGVTVRITELNAAVTTP